MNSKGQNISAWSASSKSDELRTSLDLKSGGQGSQDDQLCWEPEQVRELVSDSYKQYQEDLRRYLSKLLSSPEDIEEVLQETFLRISKYPPKREKKGKSRAYVFVIAANLVKDLLRRRLTRAEKYHVSFDNVELHAETPSPENLVISERLSADLIGGLKGLNRKYRQVFVMHRFMHLSHEEIAKKLDVSVRTVERRMSYAVDHFRSQLREYL